MLTLRPYQEQAIAELRRYVATGQPGLLVAPTGSGKSEIFGWMARSGVAKGRKVGAVVNRRILVNDLCKRVSRLGLEYGVIMGDAPRKAWAPVHIASFDTLWRRPNLPKWDFCFVDECHFSLADKYSAVIKRLIDNGCMVIGMTATPIRGDGKGLGSIYKWMVRCPDTPELMDAGYLMRPVVYGPPGAPDVSRVKKTAGEFNQKQLAEVCDKTKLIGDILKHWLPYRGRPTIGFGVDIAHCQHMAEMFSAAGVKAVAVDHTFDTQVLDDIWKRLESYDIECVFNVGIASYGWNAPAVSMMIEARPTQSLALWLQHCGRIMRPHPGKLPPVINDHAGNWTRHGLPDEPREWSLEGVAVKNVGDKARSVMTCKKCYATFAPRPQYCPYCNAIIEVEGRDIEVVEGELAEVTQAVKREFITESKCLPRFRELQSIADARGYKSGWASIQFKEQFGFWPKKAWKEPAAVETVTDEPVSA